MKWRTFYIPYLGVAAAISVAFPGGTIVVTKTGDMVELTSLVWPGDLGLDFVTGLEERRAVFKIEVASAELGPPSEEPPLPPIDWYQPLSEPLFMKAKIQHDPASTFPFA